MAIKYPPADTCITSGLGIDPKGSSFQSAARQNILDPPLDAVS